MNNSIGAYAQGGLNDIGAYEKAEAAAVGAIMNQMQGPNMGADLFNGTLLSMMVAVQLFLMAELRIYGI